MNFTNAQERVLRFAFHRPKDAPEICPRRGQERMFMRMEAEGLLEYVGWGCDSEEVFRDVRLYKITAKGAAALGESL